MSQTHITSFPKQQLGQYEVSQTLGSGLMEVKLATDPSTRQNYAAKVCTHNLHREAIQQEAEVLKELTEAHIPNIVGFIDYLPENVTSDKSQLPSAMIAENEMVAESSKAPALNCKCALILEYAPNQTIFDYISLENPFDHKLARTYFKQLIQAVHSVHQQGYAHRDIKPENLLLDKNFNLMLADFGYVQKFDQVKGDRCKLRVGTESYMAPEMLKNSFKEYSGIKVDIFACGVVLYIMMWGRPPFFAAKSTDPFYRHIAAGNPEKFWNIFEQKVNKGVEYDKSLKELITAIFNPDESQRPSFEEIAQFEWVKGECYEPEELYEIMSQKRTGISSSDVTAE